MDEVVSEGDYVVLLKSFDSGNMKIIPAMRDTIVHYGKLHFDSSPLVGSKFGSVFEIKENTMIEVKDFEAYDNELSELVTNKLSTFSDKSQFAQEKIINKKKRKNHANIVTVIRPNLLLINEMFYARDKLGGLRLDVLSQILTLANVQNGSKCLVLDHNLGLVSSAVMSRSLPDGVCIQLVPDSESIQTTRTAVKMLNLGEKTCSESLCAVTISELYAISNGKADFNYQNDVLRARFEEHLSRLNSLYKEKNETEVEMKNLESEDSKQDLRETLIKKESNRVSRHNERVKASETLKSYSMDSIILIAQNDHPLPLLKLTYPFLALSRQFVIYCDFVEPLIECYQYLKSESLAVSLNISESWLRRYQVLPDRTRPEMNISGYGGYLLSGIKALTGPDSLVEFHKLKRQ